jgi:hypothetical protein
MKLQKPKDINSYVLYCIASTASLETLFKFQQDALKSGVLNADRYKKATDAAIKISHAYNALFSFIDDMCKSDDFNLEEMKALALKRHTREQNREKKKIREKKKENENK